MALWDTRLRRVSILTPEGDFVASFRADSGLNSEKSFQVDPEGNFYILDWEPDANGRLANGIKSYLTYSPEGEYVDAIALPPAGLSGSGGWVFPTSDGNLRPFRREVVSMITTQGVIVAGHNDDYSFEYLEDGEVLFGVELPWKPIRLHPEEHAQWTARQEFISNPRIPASIAANIPPIPRYPPIPETKPAIVELWPGEDGTVWVQRYTVAHERADLPPRAADDDRPPFTWWQYPTFDVFGRDGAFLGKVVLPHDTIVRWFHSDYIWTVRPDAFDEDTAVRFRIVKN